MSDKMKVAVLIVTYNRKDELIRCIRAVLRQTRRPDSLILVDNASSDGTLNQLAEEGLVSREDYPAGILHKAARTDGTDIYLLRNESNTGGAGGFSAGMKAAVALPWDFLWMMDDDGYPSETCLKKLLSRGGHYVMPVSLDTSDSRRLSWPMRRKSGRKTSSLRQLRASWGDTIPHVTPFNGLLLSRECVENAGTVHPEFFLWGDEYDHYYRCLAAGYHPVTDLRAVFYHPSGRLPLVPALSGLLRVPYTDSPLRMLCLVRNHTWLALRYHRWYKIPLRLILYTWFFLVTRRGDTAGLQRYLRALRDGLRGDFSGHLRLLRQETGPLVSVIIPCYNAEKTVEQAVRSMLRQTWAQLEILVTDDASSDRTGDILRRLQREDRRIRIFTHTENRGIAVSLNEMIAAARGQYICRMDADDISLPERVERQVRFLQAHPEITVCGTMAEDISESGRKLGRSRLPLTPEDNRRYLRYFCTLYHPTVMAKRTFFEKYPYDPSCRGGEDYELWCRAVFCGGEKICNLPEVLLHYRKSPASASLRNDRRQREEAVSFMNRYRMIPPEIADAHADVIFLRHSRTKKIALHRYLNAVKRDLQGSESARIVVIEKILLSLLQRREWGEFAKLLFTPIGIKTMFQNRWRKLRG